MLSEGETEHIERESLKPESAAMRKLRNVDSPGVFIHITTVDRLPEILQDGVVSRKFAKRIGGYHSARWVRDLEHKTVYVGKLLEEGDLERSALIITHPGEATQVATIILKPEVERKSKKVTDAEFHVRHRLAPEYFDGIAVGASQEAEEIMHYDYIPQREAIKSLTNARKLIEGLKKEALQLMKKLYEDHPEKFLPIYDLAGNLLWPRRMSHEQIKEGKLE